METEAATWSESSNGGKAIVEQMLASEERIKSNKQDCENHISGIRARKLTIWIRLFEIEKLLQSLQGPSVSLEQVSKSLWWALKSPKAKAADQQMGWSKGPHLC